MPLSTEEKAAGRVFRAAAQGALTARIEISPPTYKVPNFLSIYRHKCTKRLNNEGQPVSIALELKEKYELSPRYIVSVGDNNVVQDDIREAQPVRDVEVPAGRFGFIYKEGHCKGCDSTALSGAGKLVDAWERPPLQGRSAR